MRATAIIASVASFATYVAACRPAVDASDAPFWQLGAGSARIVVDGESEGMSGLVGPARVGANGDLFASAFDPVLLKVGSASQSKVRLVVRGSGPGEYQQVSALYTYRRDSVLVADRRIGRVTVLDSLLRPVRTANLSVIGFLPAVIGVLDDGRIVALETGGYSASQSTGAGVAEDSATIHLVAPTADSAVVLRRVRTSFTWVDRRPGSVAVTAVPFAPRLIIAAGGDAIALGEGERCRVEIVGVALVSSARTVSFPCLRRPQLPAHREEALKRLLPQGSPAEQRSFLTDAVAAAERFEYLPEIGGLLWGPCASLWIQRYYAPGDTITEWVVLDSDGAQVGTLRAAGRQRLLRARADSIDVLAGAPDEEQKILRYPVPDSLARARLRACEVER